MDELLRAKAALVDDRAVVYQKKKRLTKRLEAKESNVTDDLIDWQEKADQLVSVVIPDLQYKIATMYNKWTLKNRSTVL